jgi:hypothetical protein
MRAARDAVDDMLTVFREVEAATATLEWHGLGLTFTTPAMMMQHWTAGEVSAELKSVAPRYQAALDAARRAREKSTSGGRGYIEYWIGRLEFGIAYLRAIDSVRAAASAEAAGDRVAASKEATGAVDHVKRALGAFTASRAIVRTWARSPS